MWNVGWGLTNSCNLSCEFCYSQAVRRATSEITDIETIKIFIDENFHLVDSVNFGTGENSLSPLWVDVVKYIHEKFPHVVQGLTTNGYLSQLCDNNPLAENVVIDCLEEIDISLDFGDRERHNHFRGNVHVYDWIIRTLELCKKYKKRTTIVFIGTNETLEITNIKNLFRIAKKYDAIVRLNLYRPTFGLNEQSKKHVPDFGKINTALKYIDNYYKILSLSDPLFSSIFTCGEKCHHDPSGINSIRILPDGSITPSTYLVTEEFRQFNIKMPNVFEKLNVTQFQNIIDRTIPTECLGCQYEITCRGGTLDRRYLWYKDFNKKDPYCPFKEKEELDIGKLKVTSNVSFKSVHDGYLPTLFFSN